MHLQDEAIGRPPPEIEKLDSILPDSDPLGEAT